jgi:branched-chain amino acid aminotransferase
MAQWAYLNNTFLAEEACTLPAGDLAVQRGYGIFDFFKTVSGRPIFLEAHLDRFYRSAAALRLPVQKRPAELKVVIEELLRKNALPNSGVRLTLTGGLSPDGYSVAASNLILTQQFLNEPTVAVFESGISLITHAHQRQLPRVKSIDYLMAIYLQLTLAETGADDVLYYQDNEVSECPRANFFVVTEKGMIATPGRNILEGITRKQVLQLAGSQASEQVITLRDLPSIQEAFITSTTKGVLPVIAIDGRQIGDGKPGPVTRQLATQLHSVILEQVKASPIS